MAFFKKTILVGASIFLVTSSFAQSYFQMEYHAVWQRAAGYTLEVAEAMPEEKYDFKPAEESMAFREQMIHVAQNLSSLSSRVTGEKPDFLEGQQPGLLSKDQVILALQKAFDHVGELIQQVEGSLLNEKIQFGGVMMTKENIFYLMRDHMAHHRGQAILHLRMNGIDPPKYRGW
jgi:uncharacterized damage-inducible protein DinB